MEARTLPGRWASQKLGPRPHANAVVPTITEPERLERRAERLLEATSWDEVLATL